MTGDERDLDDRLRDLFADERLTLPATTTTEHAVLAGVRKRRHRRLAVASAGGVLTVATLVFLASTLSGLGRAPGTVTAAALPSETLTTTSTAAPAPVPVDDVLGPYGVDGVLLGMSAKEVIGMASGAAKSGVPQRVGSCVEYEIVASRAARLKAGMTSAPTGYPVLISILVSPNLGVVQLSTVPPVRTPEGVGVGTPKDQVTAVYPSPVTVPPQSTVQATGTERPGTVMYAPVRGNEKAWYVFVLGADDEVVSMSLRSGFKPLC